jgi:hypothetical protein
MRASIDQTGTLTVQADNELEAYALDRWADGYFGKDDSAQRKSVLLIQPTVARATPPAQSGTAGTPDAEGAQQ